MSLKSNSLSRYQAVLENIDEDRLEEDQVTEPTEENLAAAETARRELEETDSIIETELLSESEEVAENDAFADTIENSIEQSEALEALHDEMVAYYNKYGSISKNHAQTYQVAMESITNNLGVTRKVHFSVEDMASKNDATVRRQFSLEMQHTDNIIKTIWDAIVRFFKKIKAWFKKNLSMTAMYKRSMEKARDVLQNEGFKRPETVSEGLANRFASKLMGGEHNFADSAVKSSAGFVEYMTRGKFTDFLNHFLNWAKKVSSETKSALLSTFNITSGVDQGQYTDFAGSGSISPFRWLKNGLEGLYYNPVSDEQREMVLGSGDKHWFSANREIDARSPIMPGGKCIVVIGVNNRVKTKWFGANENITNVFIKLIQNKVDTKDSVKFFNKFAPKNQTEALATINASISVIDLLHTAMNNFDLTSEKIDNILDMVDTGKTPAAGSDKMSGFIAQNARLIQSVITQATTTFNNTFTYVRGTVNDLVKFVMAVHEEGKKVVKEVEKPKA